MFRLSVALAILGLTSCTEGLELDAQNPDGITNVSDAVPDANEPLQNLDKPAETEQVSVPVPITGSYLTATVVTTEGSGTASVVEVEVELMVENISTLQDASQLVWSMESNHDTPVAISLQETMEPLKRRLTATNGTKRDLVDAIYKANLSVTGPKGFSLAQKIRPKWRQFRVYIDSITGNGLAAVHEVQFKMGSTYVINSMSGNSEGTVASYNASVSASSEERSTKPAWGAFDGIADTSGWLSSSTAFDTLSPFDANRNVYLQVDFLDEMPEFHGVRLRCSSSIDRQCDGVRVRASVNNGENWVTLPNSELSNISTAEYFEIDF